MTPDPVTAPDWSTVDDFVARFASVYRATAYPVRSFNGQLTGLIRLQDLGRVAPQNRSVTQLRDIAVDVAKVPVVRPDEELAGLMSKLEEDSGYALVMDGDRLVGLITPADIQRALHLANLRRRGLRSDFSPSSQI
jgi:CBS-domain-containing membrane protein